MAKRLMSLYEFQSKLVYGVPVKSWDPEEGSEVEDDYWLTDGFDDGGILYKGDEDSEAFPLVWIEQDGGGEGGGEYCYTVVKLRDKFLKIEYSYYSYNGYETEDAEVYEVEATQRLVTFYE